MVGVEWWAEVGIDAEDLLVERRGSVECGFEKLSVKLTRVGK